MSLWSKFWTNAKVRLLSLGDSPGVAPANTQERINICMKNYQRAKKAFQAACRRGDIRTKVEAQKDMAYWECYLLEAGAMSVEMAHVPFGAAGNWDSHRFVVRRKENHAARVAWEHAGAPYLGPYILVPDELST